MYNVQCTMYNITHREMYTLFPGGLFSLPSSTAILLSLFLRFSLYGELSLRDGVCSVLLSGEIMLSGSIPSADLFCILGILCSGQE